MWIYFTRKFLLSWKLVLAGGLTFIASQVLHIPLVFGMGPFLKTVSLLVNAIVLGLLAGIFEETARYILFKFILKKARSWKEGMLVGLGHGGTEALILGCLAAFGFITMLALRSGDLSTMPGIPADQVELLKQQVNAYWSAPWYMALIGFVERLFAIMLHISLSIMVLYAIAYSKPIWFWLALLWHALVDAVAVYAIQNVGVLATEGIIAILGIVSLWIVFRMRSWFSNDTVSGPGQELVASS
ncbi:MAG TPA: YhfC family glutamic-type intramembrane protease [Anaerolineales bacterium]|nr:YhfC family glutamic-type intramembrane protease [Anaerolineales bacterium]